MAAKTLFSLGEIYPSDFLKPGEEPRCQPIELKLVMEDNGLVHLEKTAPKEAMWGKYWYRSGINQTMKNELKNIVDSILPLMKFEENSVWLDIASNDGSLLSFVPDSFIKVGVDPAEDSFKQEAEKHADLIIQDYFSADVYKKARFGNQKAKVITSIAMFYDLEKPEDFLKDIYDTLDDNGVWVMQLSYTPLMIYQIAFDNICHEHVFYYSLLDMRSMLERNGFMIMDCCLNNVNGGSFRLYIMKNIGDREVFSTDTYRDVCHFRITSLLMSELEDGEEPTDKIAEWYDFHDEIIALKDDVVSFIKEIKSKGGTIWGYGASTKGNTLLQYFGLDKTLISGIADRNIDKWGLRTVGTNIPIYSESDMRKAKPDYLLILPWHFISEFKEREAELLKAGTKFIVPCPKFQIISA